jgi:hypothetical protein
VSREQRQALDEVLRKAPQPFGPVPVENRQPEQVRRLLPRTSMLERVSGPLADALTGDGGSSNGRGRNSVQKDGRAK